ncbi:hypothetical protein B296_00045738 [Ensete ventricosum]|uniref:Uncharacterized protein n=1 Tax=Ensete ventricosum TaxID=4639 RepID=A0A426XHD9_ENSVE|nr:hypothetical protein B296_00045738 [Ensete ventricosum]
MGGTYQSARLPIRGSPVIGRYRQKSTVGGRLREKKGRRRRRGKKEKRRGEKGKIEKPSAVLACWLPTRRWSKQWSMLVNSQSRKADNNQGREEEYKDGRIRR